MKLQDTLFIIPARGGSKGLPRKNILPLGGKPLICHSIDAARGLSDDRHICVSTDDAEIKKVVEDYGLPLPFVRPAELATDTAGSREVLLHALDFYQHTLGRSYTRICLLQPTSPLRKARHIEEAMQLWQDDLDMVVSVRESKANPYFNLFEEEEGYLKKSKPGNYIRRQEAPRYGNTTSHLYHQAGCAEKPAYRSIRQGAQVCDERGRFCRSRHGTRLPPAATALYKKISCPFRANSPGQPGQFKELVPREQPRAA